MKTYKDLPNPLYTKDKEPVFIHGYIIEAKADVAREVNKASAEKILNNAVNLALQFTDKRDVDDWIEAYCDLYMDRKRSGDDKR